MDYEMMKMVYLVGFITSFIPLFGSAKRVQIPMSFCVTMAIFWPVYQLVVLMIGLELIKVEKW